MFITIDGPEGSGKSSLIEKLSNWFFENLKDKNGFLLTNEPGSKKDELCRKIRSLVLNPKYEIDVNTSLMLMIADRSRHIQKIIIPALKQNKIVLCDRHNNSTIAYQAFGEKNGEKKYLDFIQQINDFVTDFICPDLNILLMVDSKIGLSRSTKKEFGKKDRYESKPVDFHDRVCSGFEYLQKKFCKEKKDFLIMDTTFKKEDEIFKEVSKFLKEYLKDYLR